MKVFEYAGKAINLTKSVGRFLYNSPAAASSARLHSAQLLSGARTIATFPFTALRMPFYGTARDVGAYNIWQEIVAYGLPVFSYYEFVRPVISSTSISATGYDLTYAADISATAFFVRLAINSYIFDTINATTASTIKMENVDPVQELPPCTHGKAAKVKTLFMAPVYNISKRLAVPFLFRNTPVLGFFVEYVLEPIALGEVIAEEKLSKHCIECRTAYFSTHNAANYGMGLTVAAIPKMASWALYYYTGVHSIFIEEAILELILPMITLHMKHSSLPAINSKSTEFDTFYLMREAIHLSMKKINDLILPSLINPQNQGAFFKLLTSAWSEPLVVFSKKMVLDPAFCGDAKTLVESGPINLLVKHNYPAIKKKLDLVAFALRHIGIANGAMSIYNFLPFVPPLEHATFIVGKIQKNRESLKEYHEFCQTVVEYAIKYDRRQPKELAKATWFDLTTKQRVLGQYEPIDLKESYIASPPPEGSVYYYSTEERKIVDDYQAPILLSHDETQIIDAHQAVIIPAPSSSIPQNDSEFDNTEEWVDVSPEKRTNSDSDDDEGFEIVLSKQDKKLLAQKKLFTPAFDRSKSLENIRSLITPSLPTTQRQNGNPDSDVRSRKKFAATVN